MEQLTYGHTSLVAEQVALCPQASGLKFDPEAWSEEMGRRTLNFSQRLRAMAARLKRELFALHLAAGDPRTPWYAKAFVACVVAYALSPIDLIPDPIPILGYLDDLLLLPVAMHLGVEDDS